MKKLSVLAALALALTACSGVNTTPGGTGGMTPGTDTVSSLTSLSGSVYQQKMDTSTAMMSYIPWAGGAQAVTLKILTTDASNPFQTVSSGTISAAGQLNITLPSINVPTYDPNKAPTNNPQPVDSPYVMECTNNLKMSLSTVKTAVGLLTLPDGSPVTGLKDVLPVNMSQMQSMSSYSLIYADGNASMTGTVQCTTRKKGSGELVSKFIQNMDVTLLKGWNMTYGTVTTSTDHTTMTGTFTSTTAPTRWTAGTIFY